MGGGAQGTAPEGRPQGPGSRPPGGMNRGRFRGPGGRPFNGPPRQGGGPGGPAGMDRAPIPGGQGAMGPGGPLGSRRKKKKNKDRKKKRLVWSPNIPRDDLLWRSIPKPMTPERRAEIRRKFALEAPERFAKADKQREDYRTIYQKMEFLEYEVENRVRSNPCPLCQKPIEDLYATLKIQGGEDLAHITCIAEDLRRRHELADGEVLSYLGNGAFGIFKTREDGEPMAHPIPKPPPEPAGDKGPRDKEAGPRPRPEPITDLRLLTGLELRKKIQYEARKLTSRQQRTQIKN